MSLTKSDQMASSIPINQRPAILKTPLETPTHGSGGVFTITCSTVIAAPLTTIITTLLDTRTYPSWNAFVPNICINKQPASFPVPPACLVGRDIIGLPTTLQLGTDCTLDVHLDPDNESKTNQTNIGVSLLEDFEHEGRQGVRVAWRTGGLMPRFALRCERVQEFLDVGHGTVEYRCWETMYGLLASMVNSVVGKSLEWGFGAWMDGLKEYSEKEAQEGRMEHAATI